MDKQDAEILIKLARRSIKKGLKEKNYKPESLEVEEEVKKKFYFKRGVFTTLHTFPENTLRGCIGIPFPHYELWEAVIISAYEAAFEDPRFNPLKKEEFEKVILELTVLTEPEKLKGKPEDYPGQIEIGKHGLMVQRGFFKGLLLPQVAVEWNFSEEQFLCETCIKAGLSPSAWKEKDTIVYRFSGILIREKKPLGEIEVKDLSSL